jgi:ATP-dependent helicase/nuclease subunit A
MTLNKVPIDKSVRDSIIADITNSHFITAGAGAGKTKSIVDRIVQLTTHIDPAVRVPMSQIVAVTFTNKAAGELRNRLRNRFLAPEVRKSLSAEQLESADLALTEIDAAAVGTIHSFAMRLLKQYPIEAKLPIGFSLIDTAEASRNTRFLSNRILSDLYTNESEENLEILKNAKINVNKMREFINQIQERQTQLLGVDVSFEGEAYFDQEISRLVVEAFNWWNINKGNLQDPNDVLRTKTELAMSTAVAAISESPPNYKAALESFDPVLKARPKNKNDMPIHADFKQQFKEKIEWHLNPDARKLESLVRTWIAKAQLAIDLALEDRRDRGEVDFNDLLLLTYTLIMNEQSVREDLFGKLKVYVVDEFQDTDPLQYAIIRALVCHPSQPKGNPVNGRLIVVGDPKQSIYRFRGADLETFEGVREFADTSWGGDNLKHLITNFRSRPGILDYVHHLYETRPAILGTNFERMAPFSEDVSSPAVFILQGGGDEEVNYELDAIAATIQQITSSQTLPDGKGERRATFNDIALLLPARSTLNEQLEVFEHVGIPYTSTDATIVYARPAVRGLISAMKVLAGSVNGGDLWWALKSPLFGLSDLEMLKHKQTATFNWPVPIGVHRVEQTVAENGSSRAIKALDELHSIWRDLRSSQPSEILESLYTRTRMQEALDQIRTGRFENDCVRMAILHAKQWEASGGNGIVDYVDWLKQMDDEETRQNLPSPDNQGYDAVKISTIHASKGLEYPIVIMGGMWNGVKSTLPLISVSGENRLEYKLSDSGISLGYATECAARETLLGEQERHRLLYVGATRAEHTLYVSNHHKGFGKPKRVGDDPELKKCWAKFNYSAIEEAIALKLAVPIEPILKPVNTTWLHRPEIELESDQRRKDIELARSIAAQENAVRPSDGGRKREDNNSTTPASAYGNAVHSMMHSLANARFDTQWKHFSQKARLISAEHGVSDRLEDLKRDVLAILDCSLILKARASAFVKPEISLMAERDGKIITGSADLVFSETKDSDLILIDYKTNMELTAEKIEKYKIQLQDYSEMLEKALNRKVTQRYLVHVHDGVIQEVPV